HGHLPRRILSGSLSFISLSSRPGRGSCLLSVQQMQLLPGRSRMRAARPAPKSGSAVEFQQTHDVRTTAPRLKLFILHINSCEARGQTPITGKAHIRGAPALKTFDDLSAIGLREWIALPELGCSGPLTIYDTGAGTSAIHASDIEPFQHEGEDWVRFTAHLGARIQRRRRCEAPLVAVKKIKS